MKNFKPFSRIILLVFLFFFFGRIGWWVLGLSWIITGGLVWLSGREAYHIGASGLIYAFASFLFFSGVIKRNIQLGAVSLLVVFLYGGIVWGMFPLKVEISWEAHLMGFVTGIVLAIYYKNDGPQRTVHLLEDDDEEDENNYWTSTNTLESGNGESKIG